MKLHPTLRLLLLVVPGVASQSPFDIDDLKKCAVAGASSDECTSTTMSEGQCLFCSAPSVSQSICVTPSASKAMKQFLPDLNCGDDSSLLLAEEAPIVPPAPAKKVEAVDDPFSDIMLCGQNSGSEDQCTSTETSDGSDCVFCSSASLGDQSVCTTVQASQMMKQFVPDLDCGDSIIHSVTEAVKELVDDPFSDIMLCGQNSGSEDQCTSTETSDGSDCVFCSSASLGDQSVCTTVQASQMMKQFVPDLDCGDSIIHSVTEAVKELVDDPFSDIMLCGQNSGSEDQCTSTETSDGSDCVFCSSASLGDQSVCTTVQASQMMKQFVPDLDCGDSIIHSVTEAVKELVDDPFSDIMLCGQNSGSEDQCTSTETSDGSDCVFCSSASLGDQSVCTTVQASQMMKQFVPDLDCGDSISQHAAAMEKSEEKKEADDKSVKDNIQDLLRCAHSGASVDQCTSTEMSDSEHCVFCKSQQVQQNICTTPSASSIMKQIVPDLNCGPDDDSTTTAAAAAATEVKKIDDSIKDTFQDIMTCAQAGTSADTCGSTKISDGEDCQFCHSASIRQSICTTPSASEMMKSFVQDLKCGEEDSFNRLRGNTQTHATNELLDLIPSSCIANSGLDDEACSESKDKATGEDCLWCPALAGNYGLCLSHDEAEIASKKGWLKCPYIVAVATE